MLDLETGTSSPLVSPGLNGDVSPDGRWVAYESAESGQGREIYVRPFPNVDDGRQQVSTNGGTKPVWARDGRTLFYRQGPSIMAVRTASGPDAVELGTPEVVLAEAGTTAATGGRDFDVSPDGQRFLVVKPVADPNRRELVVVLNWLEELKRLVPAD
jgi:serine/threonine-protein kinase